MPYQPGLNSSFIYSAPRSFVLSILAHLYTLTCLHPSSTSSPGLAAPRRRAAEVATGGKRPSTFGSNLYPEGESARTSAARGGSSGFKGGSARTRAVQPPLGAAVGVNDSPRRTSRAVSLKAAHNPKGGRGRKVKGKGKGKLRRKSKSGAAPQASSAPAPPPATAAAASKMTAAQMEADEWRKKVLAGACAAPPGW